jgi:hypothetical protein
LIAECHDTEQECGAGKAIHQPTHGDLLRPRADKGDTLSGKKEAIVSVLKSANQQF